MNKTRAQISRAFFESRKFPGWKMGWFGVCYKDTQPDTLLGGGYNTVQFADILWTDVIQAEASEAGYTCTWTVSGQRWSKPK